MYECDRNIDHKVQTSQSQVLETSEERGLGQVEILAAIVYTGKPVSDVTEVNAAIEVTAEKYAASSEPQLAVWVSSQGGNGNDNNNVALSPHLFILSFFCKNPDINAA